ncbi:hypothetical protein [Rhodobacter ferrooxidans]|uniref:Uncharacterized protein n=1 Tax=Rhodobacter ferrooxidans TaxID=371731 RepID=C8S085_9RHOB|nr:hypothetical protein [Rhodobacter sp. SW2]EEW25694.1 hypothetical protein Rsw2DRAFT_1463 [Rhodobacter sp. SW2]
MSLINAWKRQGSLELPTIVMVLSAIAGAALAETLPVRLGTNFPDAVGRPLQKSGSVAEVLRRLNLGMQLYVTDVDNCQALIRIPPWKQQEIDTLTDTHTIVQSIEAGCWAVLQFDPSTRVTTFESTDRITPAMIHGIMAHSEELSAGNDEWRKTLTTFAAGVITCKDEDRCLLALPDGKRPPDESLLFDLILAKDDARFILVTQLFQGRAGFVYGVRWRETAGGGEVISMFPEME